MSSCSRCLSASSFSMSAARALAAPRLSVLVVEDLRAVGLAPLLVPVASVLRVRARFSSVIAIDTRPFGRSDRLRWQEACRHRQGWPGGGPRGRTGPAKGSVLLFVTSRSRDAVEDHAHVTRSQQDAGEGRAGGEPALRSVGLREVVDQSGEEQDTEDYRPQQEPAAEPS